MSSVFRRTRVLCRKFDEITLINYRNHSRRFLREAPKYFDHRASFVAFSLFRHSFDWFN